MTNTKLSLFNILFSFSCLASYNVRHLRSLMINWLIESVNFGHMHTLMFVIVVIFIWLTESMFSCSSRVEVFTLSCSLVLESILASLFWTFWTLSRIQSPNNRGSGMVAIPKERKASLCKKKEVKLQRQSYYTIVCVCVCVCVCVWGRITFKFCHK